MQRWNFNQADSIDDAPAEVRWVREMHAHRQRTGTYRHEDVRRVLGDPGQTVAIGRPQRDRKASEGERQNPKGRARRL